MQGSADFVKFY